MHIVAIGWIYVVLMMSISETSVVAGILTMLLYGLVPVAILLYISGSNQRKRKRAAQENAQMAADRQQANDSGNTNRTE